MTLKTFFPSRCHLKMQMCKVARCGHGGAPSVYTAFDGAHWNAIAPLALLQPLHLPINRMSLSGLMPEMPCLFLGQTEFLVLITGGKQSSWFYCVVWYTEKVTDLCIEWMPWELQETPLSAQRNHPISPTVPFQSNQYREAGSRRNDIDEPQPFPTELDRGMRGGSLLSYVATPLPLTRLCCWENGHAEVEVTTV